MNIELNTPLALNEMGGAESQDDSVYPPVGAATPDSRFFLVCDGVGGHARGDMASGTVCRAFASFLEGVDVSGFNQGLFDAALAYVHKMLDGADAGGDGPARMATTLTFLCLHQGGAFLAHAGDSRIYHVRPSGQGAAVLFRTTDHSHVSELVRAGVITEAEAADHPKKNIVTRALQPNQRDRGGADCHQIEDVAQGDYFFLCTDGVLESIDDAMLCWILGGAGSDESKMEAIRLTCQKGSKDNFSAYLVPVAKPRAGGLAWPIAFAHLSFFVLLALDLAICQPLGYRLGRPAAALAAFAVAPLLLVLGALWGGRGPRAGAKPNVLTWVIPCVVAPPLYLLHRGMVKGARLALFTLACLSSALFYFCVARDRSPFAPSAPQTTSQSQPGSARAAQSKTKNPAAQNRQTNTGQAQAPSQPGSEPPATSQGAAAGRPEAEPPLLPRPTPTPEPEARRRLKQHKLPPEPVSDEKQTVKQTPRTEADRQGAGGEGGAK